MRSFFVIKDLRRLFKLFLEVLDEERNDKTTYESIDKTS